MPKLDDTADALALAICHTQYNRYIEFDGTDKSKKKNYTKLEEIYIKESQKDKELLKKRDQMIKKAIEKEKKQRVIEKYIK